MRNDIRKFILNRPELFTAYYILEDFKAENEVDIGDKDLLQIIFEELKDLRESGLIKVKDGSYGMLRYVVTLPPELQP